MSLFQQLTIFNISFLGLLLYNVTNNVFYFAKGPKSPWFGLVDPRLTDTYDGKVHFDANLFWTVSNI